MPRPHAPSQPPRSGPSGCGALQRLLFHGPDSLQQLNGVVAGQGIAGTTAGELPGKDGRVVWKVYRDETDELGMRHVFYRQHLLPAGALAEALGEPYASDGIPVLGGEVGVHTLADGTPRAVFGRQYREVGVPAFPAVLRAAQAVALAEDALQRRGGFASPARFTAEHRQAVLQGSRLVLEKLQDRPLALIWHVPAWDDADQAHLVRLDAVSGEAIEIIPTASAAIYCNPSSGTQQSIVGYSENTSLYDLRYLWGNSTPSRPAPWLYEAVKVPVAGWLPGIEVYFEPHPDQPSHQTLRCPTETWYGVLPLQAASGQVRYDDPNMSAGINGRAAGDALWHTYVTLSTLKESFGRCGFDGACASPAQVYMKRPGVGDLGMASHKWVDNWGICGSNTTGCVWVYSQGPYPRHASASLDVIAHEWGHRLSWNVGLPYTGEQAQLQEGFSNVLGHAVEWANHPAGNGFEKADWCFGEDHNTDYWPWWGGDCPSYWSRAEWFVPVVNHAGGTSYWLYHDQQPLPPGASDSDPHLRGHMLAVAHYLLSAGGKNPVSPTAGRGGIPGPWVTTSCHDVSGLGVTKASKILMRILTAYGTPNMQWGDLTYLGKLAAFDLYSRCWLPPAQRYHAYPEQYAVGEALAAIGHPGSPYFEQCWCCN